MRFLSTVFMFSLLCSVPVHAGVSGLNLDVLSPETREEVEGILHRIETVMQTRKTNGVLEIVDAILACLYRLKDDLLAQTAELGFTICDKTEILCSKIDNIKTGDIIITGTVLADVPAIAFTICDKAEAVVASLGFTICEKIEAAVASIGFTVCDKVENSQGSLSFTICDKVEDLCDKIDVFTLCEPTPISTQTTISVAGSYCLTTTILTVGPDPAIKITTNKVVLDLNGYSVVSTAVNVDGIQVCGVLDTVIKNGFIESTFVDPTVNSGSGILIGTGGFNIQICNVTILNWGFGIQGETDNGGILIKDSILCSSNQNMFFVQCGKIRVHNCVSDFGTDDMGSAVFDGCFAIDIKDCNFHANLSSALVFSNCQAGHVERCLFYENGDPGAGSDGALFLSDCNTFNIVKCESFANTRTNGFTIDSSNCICLMECSAKSNTRVGSTGGAGFSLVNTSTCCVVKDCTASCNNFCGFDDVDSPAMIMGGPDIQNEYLGNLAKCNGDNYCVGGAAVATGVTPYHFIAGRAFPVRPTRWDNVSL